MAQLLGEDEDEIFRLFVNMNQLKMNTTTAIGRYKEQQEQYTALFSEQRNAWQKRFSLHADQSLNKHKRQWHVKFARLKVRNSSLLIISQYALWLSLSFESQATH